MIFAMNSMGQGDTPSSFSATVRVAWGQDEPYETVGYVQDAAQPGFLNRWRLTLKEMPRHLNIELGDPVATLVKTTATREGGMRVEIALMGVLEFRPLSQEVRFDMRGAALFNRYPFESRPQNVTLTKMEDGSLEIFITETIEDFNPSTKGPGAVWLSNFAAAIVKYGHNK